MSSKKRSKEDLPSIEDEVEHLETLSHDLASMGLMKQPARKKGTSIFKTISRLLSSSNLEEAMVVIGKYFITRWPSFFRRLERYLLSADYDVLPEVYTGKMVLMSVFSYVLSFFISLVLYVTGMGMSLAYLAVLPFLAAILVFFVMYYAPIEKTSTKARSINTNLPFALTHLAAIASSGTPPEEAFRIMSGFDEFGSVGKEAKNIVKHIDVFGEDITTALKYVISTTPSQPLKEILGGILTITQTGGNLDAYLTEMADIALFDYKLAKERYMASLSTYADIYTALLITAPLFLVSILVVMNIIPDTTLPGNLSIMDALWLGVYVLIPVLNIMFLGFITLTAPEV